LFLWKIFFNFLLEIGKLKNIERRGITFYGVKNPETTNDHTFRTAMMAWIFGNRRKLNLEKLIKIALVHDLCKVYAGDITPYDGFLPRNKKERYKFVRKWPRLPKEQKEKMGGRKIRKRIFGYEEINIEIAETTEKRNGEFVDGIYEMDNPRG
jgi:putative hydrolase of HD superfamily